MKLKGELGMGKHMRKKHSEDVKQLNCETCRSEFTKEKVLQNHMKRHSSEIGNGEGNFNASTV